MNSKTALLACEWGGGYGHLARLAAIGVMLRREGWNTIFAATDSGMRKRFDATGQAVIALPDWRGFAPDGNGNRRGSVTYADVLANLGLGSLTATHAMLHLTREVLSSLNADVLIADTAPAATLASRGIVPSITVGNGFHCPPSVNGCFPPFIRGSPVRDQNAFLKHLNALLRHMNIPEADTLYGALLGDAVIACTDAVLDPYRAIRAEPVAGPVLPEMPPRKGRSGHAMVAYFQYSPQSEKVLKALAAMTLSREAHLHAPNLPPVIAKQFRRNGWQISDAPFTHRFLAMEAGLLIHAGGHGLATMALRTGIPPLAIPQDIEKQCNAEAIDASGAGIGLAFDHHPDAVQTALEDLLSNPAYVERAGSLSDELSASGAGNALDRIVETAVMLAGTK